MARSDDVRSWMALIGRRADVLHVLTTEGGPDGLTPSEVAARANLPTDVALARLNGLALVREAECRNGRWHATTRGQAVIVSLDEWTASEEIPY